MYNPTLTRCGFKGIDTFDQGKSALLSVVDKVTGAIFCGQVYYYKTLNTGSMHVRMNVRIAHLISAFPLL